jgi:hypothetical protein
MREIRTSGLMSGEGKRGVRQRLKNRASPRLYKQNGSDTPWNYYSGVRLFPRSSQETAMNGIIYLIGLIVVILAILSFFGLR